MSETPPRPPHNPRLCYGKCCKGRTDLQPQLTPEQWAYLEHLVTLREDGTSRPWAIADAIRAAREAQQ